MKLVCRALLVVSLFILGISLSVYGQETGGESAKAEIPGGETSVSGEPVEQPADKAPKIDAFRSVNGLEQWKYDYDISDYAAGKYNLIIEGTDKAGNTYTEGPYNLLIDPDSDLPVTNISNPTPDLRVGGNLNIVGTCVDDDAVAIVRIAVNDGPFMEATGTDFWSYSLNTTDMEDGPYTITAKGIDTGGVEGKTSAVVFNLDRDKPVFEITSHENGDLVNGRIELKGTVTDKNGIAAVSFSSDGGETFEALSFKGDKKAESVEFSLRIDTNELSDGAQIYWFEGSDRMGSVERSAFLFFVDNKPPELTILFPTENDSVNGVFTVSGKVADEVGVERLTWQIGREEPVEIPLRPGDPYWAQEFDYSGEQTAEILFTLIDKTGNTTDERFNRELSYDADLPVLILSTPEQDEAVTVDRIAGFLTDDDGVEGIIYSIDGGEEVSITTGQAFDIILPSKLDLGEHTVTLRAVDVYGLEGLETEVGFTKVGKAPEIALATVTNFEGNTETFSNGIEIRTDVHESIEGSVVFLNPAGTATYSFAEGDKQPLSLKKNGGPGSYSFSIPIPAGSMPFGLVDLLLEASDQYGEVSQKQVYLFVKNLSRNDEKHGIYFNDPRIDGRTPIFIDRNSPLLGRYIGYPAASVDLEPASDIVSIRERNGVVEITAEKEGVSKPVSVKVTSDRGTVFTAGPYTFTTDTSAPELTLDSSLKSGRPRGSFRLKGTVSDAVDGVTVRYTLAGEESNVRVADGSFDHSLPVGNLPEDGVLLAVKAQDSAGNSSAAYRIINRTPVFVPDPEAKKDPSPVVKVVYPPDGETVMPEDLVNGRLYAGGVVSGVQRVAELYYTIDGEEERSIEAGDTFELLIRDLEPGTHSLSFRAVSAKEQSGQSSKIDFTIAPQKPRYEFSEFVLNETSTEDYAPGMDLAVGQNAELRGAISSGSGVTGTYSVDGDETEKLRITVSESGEAAFSVPLSKYTGYGRHDIEITFTDSFDRSEELSTFYYRVLPKGGRSITEADGLFIADPRFGGAGQIVRMAPGESVTVVFSGREVESYGLKVESDVLGVRRQGNLFIINAAAEGLVTDTALTVVTEDGDEFSTPDFTVRVDDEAPVIELERDITGEWVRDSVQVSGSIADNVGLVDISVALNGTVVPTPLTFGGDGVPGPLTELPFAIDLPLEGIPEGNLTFSITAEDEAGFQTVKEYLIRRDATAPVVRQITPELSVAVNGLFTFSGLATDDSNIDTVEFSGDGVEFMPVSGTSLFNSELDLNRYSETVDAIVYRITDQAGNIELYEPFLTIDPESDKPTVQIQIPESGTLIRSDFIISGMVFDDDDVKTIYYRVDDGEFIPLEGGNNFEIELKLADLTDNRHTVEVKAEDLAGVESDIESMWFNVSTAEPKSLLTSPEISQTVRGIVDITGESIDENGIAQVFISFDNGNTFNHAYGGAAWNYALDTRTLPDGTYSLLIRAIDEFGVDGLYTTLLNIDNTLPTLELTGFMDREAFSELLRVRGRVADTIGLESVHIDILPVIGEPVEPDGQHQKNEEDGGFVETDAGKDMEEAESTDVATESGEAADDGKDDSAAVSYDQLLRNGPPMITVQLPPDEVVLENIDLSSLPAGLYNLQISATDHANNTGYISRNFEKIESAQISTIEILFPAQGERFSGEFSLQGRINAPSPPQKAALYVNGELFEALDVTQDGYFTHSCQPGNLESGGFHTVMVEALLSSGKTIKTEERIIEYRETGPWITIDNFDAGDFAANRPWIEGRTGYITDSVPEDEKEAKAYLAQFEVIQVEYSIDNGKSFKPAKSGEVWKFRLETQDIQDGLLNLLVRGRFRNGETAVAKTQIRVDDTPPEVKLIYPEEGMRFNETISLSGTAFDKSGLTDVVVALRKGDKSQYAVPSFIQGLYVDLHFLGATFFEAGAGLTFFDNNVKLSVFLGNSPSGGRFSGMVLGAKLLANIATLPYGYFFGPDLNFLSSSVAIGANFSYFSMEPEEGEDSRAIVLGAVVAQLELARFEIFKWNIFNAFSAYVEGQLWFISSDVEGGIKPKLAFGIRSEVF